MICRSANYITIVALTSFCWAGMAQADGIRPLMNSGGGAPAGAYFVAQRIPEPPQAALDACNNLTVDSSCTFTIKGHQIEGTCRKNPNDDALVCAPQGMPPPPPSPPQAAVDICKNLSVGTACMFSSDNYQIEGTCRGGPDGKILACVPQEMPMLLGSH